MTKRHINPTPANAATAPYNFVPQPESILYVEELFETELPWNSQDQFLANALSGELMIEAKARTPMFIRGERRKTAQGWDKKDSRLREEPFKDFHDKPLIPGSSFRGMIRNVLEIISFSKLTPVFPDKLFYRSMAADSIGQTYRNTLMHGGRKPMAGFFRRREEDCYIEPCEVFKIPHSAIPDLNYSMHPSYVPNPELQGKEFNYDGKTGQLIITGCAPKKKHEFLFVKLENLNENERILVPDYFIERFEDDDQITQWQQKVFPASDERHKSGGLADGDPVFYLCDNHLANPETNPSGLIFFGRAQMFRLPYDLSPAEMTKYDANKLDMAEAIFGTVKQNENGEVQAVKGRVFFSDLKLTEETEQQSLIETFVPSVLLSPRPTTFQHYLVQTNRAGNKHLRTYLNNNPTDLRGHKLYWHRWNDTRGINDAKDKNSDRLVKDLRSENPQDRTHTIIKPVRENAVFRGKIKFRNLKRMELGALLSSLELPDGCAHKIGMARPLGLGSIEIKVCSLNIVDVARRYQNWQESGLPVDSTADYKTAFSSLILKFAKKKNEPLWHDKVGLAKIFRLDALFRILSWQNRPEVETTKYMSLDEFRARKVLPTPQFVNDERTQPFEEKIEALNEVKDLTAKPESLSSLPLPEVATKIPQLTIGKDFKGTFTKTVDGWVAKFSEDQRNGQIVNANRLPDNLKENQYAIFVIRELKKSQGLKVEFRSMIED